MDRDVTCPNSTHKAIRESVYPKRLISGRAVFFAVVMSLSADVSAALSKVPRAASRSHGSFSTISCPIIIPANHARALSRVARPIQHPNSVSGWPPEAGEISETSHVFTCAWFAQPGTLFKGAGETMQKGGDDETYHCLSCLGLSCLGARIL